MDIATDSILDSTKKKLGLDPEAVTELDLDIIDAINLALNVLTQINVGPQDGFIITDNTATWHDFVGDNKLLTMVKSYIYVKVKLLFDNNQTAAVISVLQELEKEYLFRINVYVESPETYPIS